MNANNNQNYQVSEEAVKDELKYIRTVYDSNFKQAALVKNWCLTIWIAILIGIITTKIDLSANKQFIILVLPVLLFWFLEAIYGSKLILLVKYETELENKLSKRIFTIKNASDIFAASWFKNIKFHEKIEAFLEAFFRFETIILFYPILIVISALVTFYW